MPSSFHLRHTVILLPLVAVLLFVMVKLPFPIATFGRMDSWFVATAQAMQQKSPLNFASPLADIVQVASGGNHSCALTSAGAVFCWGSNDDGQLGDSTNLLRMAPTAVVGLSSGVTTISAGGAHTCAATNNGLFCWGRNNNGQVGDGSRTDRNTPVAIDGLGSGITALATGANHTCAATASTVRCWGDNLWGQLGDGTATDRTTPVLVTNLSGNVAELVAGEGHTCARSGSAAVRCWGRNQMGQLGDGTTIGRTTPMLVTNLSGGITDLAAGANYTCAVTGQNSPVCWGENEQGQLGDGTTTNRSTPIAVSGLPGETVALAAGLAHSCAIVDMTEKALYCWGFNQDGQLGNATTENRLNPVQVSTFGRDTMMVSLGANHSCALRGATAEATALYCWGANYYGQLGYGAPTTLSPQSTVALDNVAALTAGRDHSCALNNAGAVYCWGNNEHGQLGDGTRTRRAAPVAVSTLGSGVIAVRAGDSHTCALLTGGALRCWGGNQWGQIGDGTTIDRLTPVSVGNFTGGVTALHVGYDYSCILTDAAMTYCWGWNGYGQVGDGTREHRALPVTVSNVSGEPIALAGGNSHVCLLTKLATANAVSCWGHNLYGQLGDGTRTDHITPAPVHGLAGDVETIIAKGHHTCAIAHSEKTLRCWGANGTGQLGDGTDIVRTTPVAVAGLPATVASSIAGYFHTCGSTTASALFCWGDNSSGQLGDGTLINRLTPTRISDLSGDVVALAAGYAHTCALSQESTADRVVHCWGSNLFGQLGNDAAWRTTPMLVIDPNAAPEPTPVPPPPPTATPHPNGDPFENDDLCEQSNAISADGSVQEHTFHQAGDADWSTFPAAANTIYRIFVDIPANSPVDVTLNLYTDCEARATTEWNETFAPGAEVDISIPVAGPIFVELANQDQAQGGQEFRYNLSVRALPKDPDSGAVIIVAGRLKQNDPLQRNIHNVTDRAYRIFTEQGYTNENIYYLATDPNLPGFDATATKAGLAYAITEWAPRIVGQGNPLTIYMMDHGEKDQFFLDGLNGEIATPQDLNQWLAIFEEKVPTAAVNVIIEACYIGSFIEQPNSISKAGRVVITSSNSTWSAYASRNGAHFSDHFLTELQQGHDLSFSFDKASQSVNATVSYQYPWLDGNGNTVPNEEEDFAIAAERGFAFPGTLSDGRFPPYIVTAAGPTTIENRRGIISAEVQDDKDVESVWAIIYAPSYQAPTNEQELIAETAPTLLLNPQGNNRFAVEYPGFDEIGTYRIVIYAKDSLDNLAPPKVVTTTVATPGSAQLFLPIILR